MGGAKWDSSQEFIIERLIGRMVADGKSEVPGRGVLKGQGGHGALQLYRVLWEGWPEELATWEEEDDIPCGEQDFVAEYEAAHQASEAGEAAPEGSDDESGDELCPVNRTFTVRMSR